MKKCFGSSIINSIKEQHYTVKYLPQNIILQIGYACTISALHLHLEVLLGSPVNVMSKLVNILPKRGEVFNLQELFINKNYLKKIKIKNIYGYIFKKAITNNHTGGYSVFNLKQNCLYGMTTEKKIKLYISKSLKRDIPILILLKYEINYEKLPQIILQQPDLESPLHCLNIIGESKSYYIVLNSHSEYWGDSGYGYILKDTLFKNLEEIYVLTSIKLLATNKKVSLKNNHLKGMLQKINKADVLNVSINQNINLVTEVICFSMLKIINNKFFYMPSNLNFDHINSYKPYWECQKEERFDIYKLYKSMVVFFRKKYNIEICFIHDKKLKEIKNSISLFYNKKLKPMIKYEYSTINNIVNSLVSHMKLKIKKIIFFPLETAFFEIYNFDDQVVKILILNKKNEKLFLYFRKEFLKSQILDKITLFNYFGLYIMFYNYLNHKKVKEKLLKFFNMKTDEHKEFSGIQMKNFEINQFKIMLVFSFTSKNLPQEVICDIKFHDYKLRLTSFYLNTARTRTALTSNNKLNLSKKNKSYLKKVHSWVSSEEEVGRFFSASKDFFC